MSNHRLPNGQGLVLVGHPLLDIRPLPGRQAGDVFDLVGQHLDVGDHADRGGVGLIDDGFDCGGWVVGRIGNPSYGVALAPAVGRVDDLHEAFELRIVADPGGVHHAADALDLGRHFHPGHDPSRVGIVIARQDLLVSTVGEELQAVGVILAPVGDDHAAGQALPGAGPGTVALGQVHRAIAAGVVEGVEHVVPGQDGPGGIGVLDNLGEATDVVGQDLAAGHFAIHARVVPAAVADLVVGHHVAVRLHRFLDPLDLLGQQVVDLGLAQAAVDLMALAGKGGEVIAERQPLAVAESAAGGNLDCGRLVPIGEVAGVGVVAQLGIADRGEVPALDVFGLAVFAGHAQWQAGAADEIDQSARLDLDVAPPDLSAAHAPGTEVQEHLGVVLAAKGGVQPGPAHGRLDGGRLPVERIAPAGTGRYGENAEVGRRAVVGLGHHRDVIIVPRQDRDLLAQAGRAAFAGRMILPQRGPAFVADLVVAERDRARPVRRPSHGSVTLPLVQRTIDQAERIVDGHELPVTDDERGPADGHTLGQVGIGGQEFGGIAHRAAVYHEHHLVFCAGLAERVDITGVALVLELKLIELAVGHENAVITRPPGAFHQFDRRLQGLFPG